MISLSRIIEYGLYLLIFLLPIQIRWIIKAGEINNGYSEYSTISLYATDILIIFLILLFAFYRITQSRQSEKNISYQPCEGRIPKLWLLIAGFELVVFISIFVAPSKSLALFYYARLLVGIGLFYLIVSFNYNKIKLIMYFLSGVLLQAMLGIWQFLSQSSFASKWLGMAKHLPGDLGVSVVETLNNNFGAGRWLRAYGGLDHPNILGGLLVVGVLFCGWLIVDNKITFINYKHKKSILYYLYFILLTAIAALFFTFSRGAWLGLILSWVAWLCISIIKKDKLIQKKVLRLTLIISMLVFILFIIFNAIALTRLSKDARLELKSNQERMASYEEAKEILKNNWLFGAGIGNYTLAMKEDIHNNLPSYQYQPVHNVFLLVFSEIGIIGFSLFIFIIILIFKQAWNNSITQGEYIYLLILFSIIIMFSVDHWWWSLHFGIVLLSTITGIIIKQNSKISNIKV